MVNEEGVPMEAAQNWGTTAKAVKDDSKCGFEIRTRNQTDAQPTLLASLLRHLKKMH
jgi:hypothetical protein